MTRRAREGAVYALAALPVVVVHGGLALLARRPDVRQLAGDEITYLETARRVLEGLPTSDELLWPPLYPRVLAVLEGIARRLRPADRWHVLEIELVQTVLLLVAAWCAGVVARRIGLGRTASAAVAVGVAAYPPLAAFAHYLWPEVLHLALFLGALALLAGRRLRDGDGDDGDGDLGRSVARGAFAGVLLGLALLTKSLLTGFLPVLLVAVWLDRTGRLSDPRRLAAPIALAVGLLTVTGPLLVHNRTTHGLWTIADSSSLNLWVGLQDDQRRNHLDSIPWLSLEAYRAAGTSPVERRAFARRQVAELIDERGAVETLRGQLATQYFRLFDRDSYLLDMLPGGALTPEGYGYLAAPPAVASAIRWLSWTLHALLLAAAAWGLAHQRLGRPRAGPSSTIHSSTIWRWVLVAFLGYNLVLFLGLHVKTRYLVQLLPFLMIWAADGVEIARRQLRGDEDAESSTLRTFRRVFGAALVVVVLSLAFGGRWI